MGVAADWLTSAWGQNAGNHQASPAAAAVETVAASWLLELLDLPRRELGRLRHRRDGRQLRLPRRGARRRAAPGRLGRRGQRPVRRAADHRADRRRCAYDRVLGAAVAGLGHDASSASPPMTRAASCRLPSTAAAGRSRPVHRRRSGRSGQHRRFRPLRRDHPDGPRHGAWVHVDGAFGLWARVMSDAAAPGRMASTWPIPGRRTGTNGCRRPTIAATRSSVTKPRIAAP